MHDEMNSPTEHLRYGYSSLMDPLSFQLNVILYGCYIITKKNFSNSL